MAKLPGDTGLTLNPDLDWEALARTYAETGRLQIPAILAPENAEWLANALETRTPWSFAYWGDDQQPHYLPLPSVKAMPAAALQDLMKSLMDRSGEQYGFAYMNYRMITAYIAGQEPDHPLHRLTEFLNSPSFLDFARTIVGEPGVRKVDGQATLFRPGDFLCRHDDSSIPGVERIAAYTLGFTRRWRSDWGGQLAFHDDHGDVAQALVPRWNTLTLFKVPTSHSVIPVAPYAQAPRISVVGWLRKDA